MLIAATPQPRHLDAWQRIIRTTTPRVYFREVGPSAENRSVLLTVAETADMLRVSKWTIYTQFIHTRRLETIKVGRRRLVPVTAVQALIESLRADGAQ
jgi:excisionase family DNA binding protein